MIGTLIFGLVGLLFVVMIYTLLGNDQPAMSKPTKIILAVLGLMAGIFLFGPK